MCIYGNLKIGILPLGGPDVITLDYELIIWFILHTCGSRFLNSSSIHKALPNEHYLLIYWKVTIDEKCGNKTKKLIKLHIFATTNKIVRCKQTKREQGSPCAINVSH